MSYPSKSPAQQPHPFWERWPSWARAVSVLLTGLVVIDLLLGGYYLTSQLVRQERDSTSVDSQTLPGGSPIKPSSAASAASAPAPAASTPPPTPAASSAGTPPTYNESKAAELTKALNSSRFHAGQLALENRQLKLAVAQTKQQLEQVAVVGQKTNDEPVWNYWLSAGGDKTGEPKQKIGELRPNVAETLRFRLSAADLTTVYPQLGTAGSTPALREAIRAGVADESRHEIALHVLVHPSNNALAIKKQSRQQQISINLDELRQRARDRAPPLDASFDVMRDWLLRSQITDFAVDFTVTAAGTYDMGISIVDAATGYPLQSMVVTLKSGALWPQSVSVRASGQTLLTSQSSPFDLALYLFDLDSADSRGSARKMHAQLAKRDKVTGRYEFIDWQTEVALAELRKAATAISSTVGEASDSRRVEEAGLSMGQAIFEPLPATQDQDARVIAAANDNIAAAARARRLVHEAAGYPAGALPPSFLVTLISDAYVGRIPYSSDVIPIGAIGVADPRDTDAPSVFLGERFALALAIPDQRVQEGSTCPSSWYVSVPDSTVEQKGALTDALAALQPVADTWLTSTSVHAQPANLDDLRGWLAPDPKKPVESVVFTYLGHHSLGTLFLREGGATLYTLNIRREFGVNSVVILNACSSAMDSISAGTTVGKFAERKVAATIATTSKVSGKLAAAYLDCFGAVISSKKSLTIGQAHALTTQCLANGSPEAASGESYGYRRTALKYMLIGNPHQRICNPNEKAKT